MVFLVLLGPFFFLFLGSGFGLKQSSSNICFVIASVLKLLFVLLLCLLLLLFLQFSTVLPFDCFARITGTEVSSVDATASFLLLLLFTVESFGLFFFASPFEIENDFLLFDFVRTFESSSDCLVGLLLT